MREGVCYTAGQVEAILTDSLQILCGVTHIIASVRALNYRARSLSLFKSDNVAPFS